MKARTVMMTDEMKGLLLAAGFSPGDDPELQRRLQIFALLVMQHRTEQLMAMFQAFGQSELRACAHACHSAGHVAAAELLLAHADAWVVTADALSLQQLRQRLQAPG